jgi:hypothetical protein
MDSTLTDYSFTLDRLNLDVLKNIIRIGRFRSKSDALAVARVFFLYKLNYVYFGDPTTGYTKYLFEFVPSYNSGRPSAVGLCMQTSPVPTIVTSNHHGYSGISVHNSVYFIPSLFHTIL